MNNCQVHLLVVEEDYQENFLSIEKELNRLVEEEAEEEALLAKNRPEKTISIVVLGLAISSILLFRNLFDKASKRKGGAGENLLIMLESRLDNVVFRMGFAATRREARQLVNHGHFLVNGKKADIPSMELKAGDVVSVKAKSQSSPKFNELKEMIITTPAWIDLDLDKFEGKIVRTPERADVDLPIEEHYIVEFYSR